MTRTEMVDNLLDSYTIRELRTLANRLGIDLLDNDVSHKRMVFLADRIHNILFDPGVWHEKFYKLAEEQDNVS